MSTWRCVRLGQQARDMLRALRQTLPPCPSVGSVTAGIEQLIQAGDLAPAARIFPGALAKKLGVPVEHVDLALADLAARGLVEVRASGRAIITSTAPDDGSPGGAYGRQQAADATKGGASAV
ncbi:hypothetical protein ACF06Q_08740 [Streptomyces leeuwenhoekii]|uniref:hypothetical protein n=1 Tax=Streptomyces leeuwenhoekii TaxID=1437453 RepID=UPI0036F51193